MSDPIDWDLAVATATRLAPKGPDLPADETRAAVRMLRDLAREAVAPVREVTGLVPGPMDCWLALRGTKTNSPGTRSGPKSWTWRSPV